VASSNGNGRRPHQSLPSQRIFPELTRHQEMVLLNKIVGITPGQVLLALGHRFRPKYMDEKGWTYVSYNSLTEQIGLNYYWQAKRALYYLRRLGVVHRETRVHRSYGWRNWWWIDRERLTQMRYYVAQHGPRRFQPGPGCYRKWDPSDLSKLDGGSDLMGGEGGRGDSNSLGGGG